MEAYVQRFEEHGRYNVEYRQYVQENSDDGTHAMAFMDTLERSRIAETDVAVVDEDGGDAFGAEADERKSAEENPPPGPRIDKLIDCDQSIFEHQKKIEEILRDPLKGTRGSKNTAVILDIYSLGLALNVSDAGGKLLLDFLNKHITMEKDDKGSRFTTWTGLKAAIARNVKKQCPVQCLSIPLDEKFFGKIDLRGKALKATKCWHYPLMHRLGEAMLFVKPEHFCKEARQEIIEGSM